ncbi:MAG TPA: hypothetical protein VGG61_02175 [Gemmataceae bacterium]|jgi:hypothetical protein
MTRKLLNVVVACCVVGIMFACVIKLPYGDFEGPGWNIWITATIAITVMFTVLAALLPIQFGRPVFAFLRRHTWTLTGSILLFVLSCVAFLLFLFAVCITAVWVSPH